MDATPTLLARRARRSGRLPLAEVKRITALYQLRLPEVVIEAALTRASADHVSAAPPDTHPGWHETPLTGTQPLAASPLRAGG